MSMSETETVNTETVSGTVLEQNEDGYYRVTAPIGGMEPDEISILDDGTRYTFSVYAGKDCTSKVGPDVLLYREVSVT